MPVAQFVSPFWADVIHLVLIVEMTVTVVAILTLLVIGVRHLRKVEHFLVITKGWAGLAERSSDQTARAARLVEQTLQKVEQVADAAAISKH